MKEHDYGEDMEFDPKGGSFKELTMLHFHNCVKFMSVEFRGGYYSLITIKDGPDKEIYVPDTREIYSNAVLALAILLIPKYDEKMKEAYKEYDGKITDIKEKFMEASSPNEEIILGDSFYTNEEDRLFLETYKQKKLEYHIVLFKKCSELLGRKNYLSIGGGEY